MSIICSAFSKPCFQKSMIRDHGGYLRFPVRIAPVAMMSTTPRSFIVSVSLRKARYRITTLSSHSACTPRAQPRGEMPVANGQREYDGYDEREV